MAEKHISLPKPYSGGDFSEWIQRFEICCDANGWDADKQLKKLPTLLEGEALAVWLEAADDERGSYDIIKKKLIVTLNPDSFVALDEFHKRRLRPDETPTLYVFRLKKMLEKTGIEGDAVDKMVLHQFLAGLPTHISRQLRALGETADLKKAVEKARLLIGMEKEPVAATKKEEEGAIVELREQVAVLSKQIETLNIQQRQREDQQKTDSTARRCFGCGGLGHFKYQCPSQRFNGRCRKCGRNGHLARNCRQGNEQGAAAWGGSRTGKQ